MGLKMEYYCFLKRMKTDILDTPEQERFNNFLSQIEEEQKNINMKSFEKYFSYKKPLKRFI